MFLYHTSISGSEVAQPKPELSLGGYKSSSRVNSGILNNMFSDITPMTISNYNQKRYIGLVLKNESGADVTGINAWFSYPDSPVASFKIAAVSMIEDTEGNLYMEHIQTVNSKPLYGEFFEAAEEVNKVLIGNLLNGSQVGIWIEMEIDIAEATSQFETVYEPVPGDDYRFQEVVKEMVEEIGFNIAWD